jgi:hypothetical protein
VLVSELTVVFVAGQQDDLQGVDQFLLRQPAVLVVQRLDQRAGQIAERGGAPVGDQACQHLALPGRGLLPLGAAHLDTHHRPEVTAQPALLLGVGETEQLADDQQRERIGETLLEIGHRIWPCGLQAVQQLPGDLTDSGRERVDTPGSEGVAHQAAKPAVVGPVGVEHRLTDDQVEQRPSGGYLPARVGAPVPRIAGEVGVCLQYRLGRLGRHGRPGADVVRQRHRHHGAVPQPLGCFLMGFAARIE